MGEGGVRKKCQLGEGRGYGNPCFPAITFQMELALKANVSLSPRPPRDNTESFV